jgi:hypothetical protein
LAPEGSRIELQDAMIAAVAQAKRDGVPRVYVVNE